MSFVDFERLTIAQQGEAYDLRPKWPRDDFRRFRFWVKPDGHLSRRYGHHTLTERAGKELDAMLQDNVRSKGDLRDWKPGTTFTNARD